MEKADMILAAIEQMGRNLDARIDRLDSRIDKLDAKLDARIESVRTDINGIRTDIARLETEVKGEARVVHARLDEQRQTINALIPQRIAAVGRTDAPQ